MTDADLAKAVVEMANSARVQPAYMALLVGELLRKVASSRGHFAGLHLRGLAEEIEDIFAS